MNRNVLFFILKYIYFINQISPVVFVIINNYCNLLNFLAILSFILALLFLEIIFAPLFARYYFRASFLAIISSNIFSGN